MFGKVVTLDKKDYVVSFDEYNQIPHLEYNNLKIIDKILLKLSFDKFKLLLQDDYKNMENMRNNEKII